jgi:hypothetical protein
MLLQVGFDATGIGVLVAAGAVLKRNIYILYLTLLFVVCWIEGPLVVSSCCPVLVLARARAKS